MATTTSAIEDDAPEIKGLPAQRLDEYVRIRERRRQLKKLYETEDAPFKETENLLLAWLLRYLTTNGLENIKTPVGTAFLTTKATASLKDPDEFMKYVLANSRFDLLDRKANTTAVKQFLKENNALPPGVNLSPVMTVGVHKKVGGKLVED